MVEEKKQRSDAGQVRLKPRDYAALTWIVDMRGVTEPDLGWLLAQIDGKPDPIAEGGARQVVRRWEKAKLAEAQRVLVGEPRLITATTRAAVLVGAARLGSDGRPTPLERPAWTQINHVAACARTRLAMQAELGADLVEWVSDRELRARDQKPPGAASSGLGRRHQPDARVTLADGSKVAVEVELTAKAPSVLDKIVDDLSRSILWDRVRYFATPEAARAVESALVRAKLGKNPITIEPIPQNPILKSIEGGEANLTNRL
jgi:hypothetical protein